MHHPADLPFVFGGLDPAQSAFESAHVLIWPVPYEKSVSDAWERPRARFGPD
jgi:hypothetical protein